MLTLYIRTTCGHCHRVLRKAEELGVVLDLKDIGNPENAAALVAKGGKQQVPYLVDEAHSVTMYESEEIAAYLEKTYPKL